MTPFWITSRMAQLENHDIDYKLGSLNCNHMTNFFMNGKLVSDQADGAVGYALDFFTPTRDPNAILTQETLHLCYEKVDLFQLGFLPNYPRPQPTLTVAQKATSWFFSRS